MEYAKLEDFFQFASQTLPIHALISAFDRGVAAFLASTPEEITLTSENIDRLVLHILFEAIMHTPLDMPAHHDIIARVSELSHGFFTMHASGRLPKDFPIGVNDLPCAVSQLVEPLVLSEIDRQYTDSAPGTLLSHFLLTNHIFHRSQHFDNVDNVESCNLEAFLSTGCLSHLLFECLFLAHHSLVPCLRTLLSALSARPTWRRRLSRELTDNLDGCPYKCIKHKTQLTVSIPFRPSNHLLCFLTGGLYGRGIEMFLFYKSSLP